MIQIRCSNLKKYWQLLHGALEGGPTPFAGQVSAETGNPSKRKQRTWIQRCCCWFECQKKALRVTDKEWPPFEQQLNASSSAISLGKPKSFTDPFKMNYDKLIPEEVSLALDRSKLVCSDQLWDIKLILHARCTQCWGLPASLGNKATGKLQWNTYQVGAFKEASANKVETSKGGVSAWNL